MKLKKGDKVIVIAGKARGETGTIARMLPRESKVLIDGINIVKRHRKPNAQSRTGQIVEMPVPIHISNVMLSDPKDGKPTRVKVVRDDDGVHRVAVKSGQQLK